MDKYLTSPLERLLFENHPLPLWIYELKTLAFLAVNDAAVKKYGYSREEFLQMTLADIRPPDDVPLLLESMTGERPSLRYSGVWRHRLKDGSIIDVEIISHTLNLAGQDAALVTIQDVTEHKRVKQEARLSQSRLMALVNAAMDAVVTIDSQHNIVLFNPAAEKMFGYKEEEILGKPLNVLLPEREHTAHTRFIEHFGRTGVTSRSKSRLAEVTGRRSNGDEFPLEASISQVDIGEEKIFTAVLRDISERKQAEIILRESEDKYRTVVENASDGIAIVQNGRVMYANRRLAEMRGEETPEIIGQRFDKYIHPGEKNRVLERYRQRAAGDTAAGMYETVLLRKGNISVSAEITTGLISYQGAPAEIVIVRDISERKQAEQALQRQLWEMTALNSVATAGAKATDVDELIQSVTNVLGTRIYPDNCGVLLADEVTGTWWPHPSYMGISAESLAKQYPFSEGIAGKVIRTGETLRVGNIQQEPAYQEATPGIQSEICIPIVVNGKIFGCLNAESRKLDAFIDHDERFMKTVADSLAIAIEKIQLLQKEKKRREEAEVLRETTLSLTFAMESKELYKTILDTLQRLIPYDSASIEVMDQGYLEIVAGRGLPDPESIIGIRYSASESKWGELMELRKPIIISDVREDDRFVKFPGTEYIRSWMGIPLIARDKLIGYINLDSRSIGFYTEAYAAIAQTFGNQAAIAIDNARLLNDLQTSNAELIQAYDTTLEGWAKALELRDKETEGHSRRVTDMTLSLARQFGISGSALTNIRRGVLLHDIGKMGVSDQILKKAGPLTPEEWEEMRKHPQYAYDLLHPIGFLRPALDIPYCHHERWDGNGYPRGLKGDQIPWAARIFAVIDVWDALSHDRPYRKAWAKEQIISYITEMSKILCDPTVVSEFLKMMDTLRK